MPKRFSQIDPLEIERAARRVPGVAFAEVGDAADGRRGLSIVLYQDAPGEETAGLVEVALREIGVEVQAGDVRIAGYAGQMPGAASGVKVIDLGKGTWATESESDAVTPVSLGSPGTGSRTIGLVSVTVSRSRDRCRARVEVDAGDGVHVGDASGPATDMRMRRSVSEAAAKAAATALGLGAPDVEHVALITLGDVACAIVVIGAPGESPERRVGSSLVTGDAWHSFAMAALQAAAALAD
ncbi:MAG TPA: hypothetical protein VM841_03370 [Actinomycetota bacterium]|nr:hypothetical protein [Actinomycetota bacterium]